MNRRPRGRLMLALALLLSLAASGCGGSGASSPGAGSGAPAVQTPVAALQATDTNLIFVVTPDLAHNAGDVNPGTANLTNQGLQRALRLATWLSGTLLASANATGIYALVPTTHLQTADSYPDMVPLEIMEQFALLNRYSENLLVPRPARDFVGDSFPINLSYTAASLPSGAATPHTFYASCQGIDYADSGGGNEALVNSIIARKQGGYHVFALPFDTLKALLGNLKALDSYGYDVPGAWQGPNSVYVLSVPPAGASAATLTAYDTGITPGQAYPAPIPPYQHAPNNLQAPFVIQPSTVDGSSVPANINTNQTVYFVRHGEAHPASTYEDGNLVMPGNWRALYLPAALAGTIKIPDFVYAVDPAQVIPGMPESGQSSITPYSYVRTSQTVAPYAIAHGIPFCVASGFQWSGTTRIENTAQVEAAVDFYFTGGRFSNKTLLVGWEHDHIPPIAQAMVNRYFADPNAAPVVPSWPGNDYDTIWTYTLDAEGKLVLSNKTCEGIDSAALPSTPPAF